MVLLFARVVLSESCIENPSGGGGGGGGDYVWPRKLLLTCCQFCHEEAKESSIDCEIARVCVLASEARDRVSHVTACERHVNGSDAQSRI
jgi:hypothetical protein